MAEYNPSKIIKDGNTYNFRDTTKIPLAGTSALAGSVVPNTDNAYDLGDSTYGFKDIYTNKMYLKGSTIFNVVDDNYICVGGATAQANGANLTLNGKNRSTSAGEFKLEARDGTYTRQLIGKPDGTLSWTGSSLIFTNAFSIAQSADASLITFNGGSGFLKGAQIVLYGKDYTTNVNNRGACIITVATDANQFKQMVLKPDGTLIWDNKNVAMQEDTIPRSGGAVISGSDLSKTNDSGYLRIRGGSGYDKGAQIGLYGKDETGTYVGAVYLHPSKGSSTSDWKDMYLYPDGRWTWSGSACVVSSDSRLKDEINSISDEVLNAWEALEPKQYKLKSDLETDKDTAQIHYGWIAQDVESIIKGDRKGEVKNGLWLHEEWEEQAEVSHEETYTEEVQTKSGETETVTKTRKVIDTPYKAKGDSYGLRYTECLVVECAFLRKKNKELQEQLNKLSARLDKLESASSK